MPMLRKLHIVSCFSMVLPLLMLASPRCHALFLVGANVHIGEMNEFVQFGRVGDVVGFLGDVTVCNNGSEPLDWLTGVAEKHPFINFNLYRLKDGRLEQIGQSWTKHGTGASQEDSCNFGCQPYPTADRLGVGCSDTYDAEFNNNTLSWFGPRSEIDPWNGDFNYPGSHIAQGPHNHGPIDHKCQVHDADLDRALNPGAIYICEDYVLAWDDAYHGDSVAHEQAIVTGTPGGTWNFDLSAIATHVGPAITEWPGANVILVPDKPVDDGVVYLAVKTTQNPNGSWHYEYAVYNHDMDRGIGGFAVPYADQNAPANLGFHAVASHEEKYSNDDWFMFLANSSATWTTEDYNVNPLANPIRWGTMYNFWVDSLAAPGDASATLWMFKPGTPASYSPTISGPVVPRVIADLNNDNMVNVADLLAVINAWGACPAPAPNNCPADVAPTPAGDGVVNVNDLLLVINHWG